MYSLTVQNYGLNHQLFIHSFIHVRLLQVDYEAIDRQGARVYWKKLVERLPRILECWSMTEADEAIQQLASDVCAGK